MDRIWSFFVNKSSFSVLLTIALVVFGIMSMVSIPKESAPEVQIPIGIVTTVFPGASALDIEKLITNKIEEQLSSGLTELNKLTSSSREGVSVVVAEFNASADIDESINELKEEVDKAKSELPSEAEDPFVSEVNFVDQPIQLISISSDLPITEFIKLTDDTISELKTVKGVSKIEKSGLRDREVQVIVNKEALDQFDISLLEVVNSINRANSSLPVGTIELEGVSYTVRFEGDIEDPAEIRDIAITDVGGEPVYVRDVAFVSDGVSDNVTFSRTSIGGNPSEQAVTLSVFKKRGGDITRIADNVKEKLSELEGGLLKDANVLIAFDTGEFVKDDLKKLSFTAFQTILLVVLILLLALGWRPALIAGIAVPLSFLIAFIGLEASGNTINFVSLFSLILAVGILVDSAIVITEGMYARIIVTHERRKAALETIKEFHWPLTSGTMTTIAVFAPLFLISGVTGQFIASIPFTIIFVLLASLFVALGVVPLIAAKILKKTGYGKTAKLREKVTHNIQDFYRKILIGMLGRKRRENLFMVGIVLLFIASLALPITGVVKTIFFPGEDTDFIFVEIEKPEGTTLGETDLTIRRIEEVLYEEETIESFVTNVGSGSFFTEGGSGSKFGSMTINLKKDRVIPSSEVVERLRGALSFVKDADIRVDKPDDGPPTGAPILIKFLGDDLSELESLALRAEDILNGIDGTVDVTTSTKNNATDLVIRIDRAKAAQVGVDASTVAIILRTALEGSTATTIKTQGEDIDVEVKLALNSNYQDPHDTDRTTIDSIRYIEIPAREGRTVLLGSLIETSIEQSATAISHDEGDRVASVSGEVREGVVAGDVISLFNERREELGVPAGVEVKIGGETEDVDQSFKDMGVALILGMILIVSILILQFNSFRQAFFIIIIVPFSLIGIFAGLAISGKTVSFPSIMGFIALSGIVVNNSIILIDKMNNLRRSHPKRKIKDLVIEASVSRLRPILLTTLTTVIGIIPLTYASELWSPLAFSIMFGLSFAVFITIILVPILYSRWPGRLE